MRGIKLRVWDKDLKKMHICGENVHDSISFIDNQACYYNLQNGCGSLPDGKGTYELMQYTGLKDKNGTEIYEGDILKGHYWLTGKKNRFIGAVVYKGTGFRVEGVGKYRGIVTEFFADFEIIGNIYEHPHLLKGE